VFVDVVFGAASKTTATITKTIGKVRVACRNAATDGVAVAKMASRGSAANSVAAV